MLIINSGFDVELEGKKFRVDLDIFIKIVKLTN